MRVVGYVRVSTDEQAASGNGLHAQETAIRAECERRGWNLIQVERDEGESGSTLDRPGLARALQHVADRAVDGLVVSKLDRITRSVTHFGLLLDWFTNDAEATLVAIDVAIDSSTPGGRLVANVFASVAEWERATISLRTKEGLAALKQRGQPVSGPAVSDDAKLHRRIARMRARGMTLRAIASRLNDEGVPTVRGGKKWHASTIQSVLGLRRSRPRTKPATLPRVVRRPARAAG
jgi:DNA invertase Pin-like site-specific DNA recombinase